VAWAKERGYSSSFGPQRNLVIRGAENRVIFKQRHQKEKVLHTYEDEQGVIYRCELVSLKTPQMGKRPEGPKTEEQMLAAQKRKEAKDAQKACSACVENCPHKALEQVAVEAQ